MSSQSWAASSQPPSAVTQPSPVIPPPSTIPVFQFTKTGRNKPQKSDFAVQLGGQYVRTVEMFLLPSVVINFALLHAANQEDDEDNNISPEYVPR